MYQRPLNWYMPGAHICVLRLGSLSCHTVTAGALINVARLFDRQIVMRSPCVVDR
jgi:hypothetical protein